MKRFIFLVFVCMVCVCQAQTVQDSVKIRLETDAGAEIGIDDDLSSTNILVKKVNVGSHTVIVRFGSNFRKEYKLDVVASGDHVYTYKIHGTLQITTNPSAAVIYVDGIRKGVSPLSLDLLGDHNIRIEKDPQTFFDITDRISIQPFEQLSEGYTLIKRPPRLYGMVLITGSPSSIGGFLGICRRFGAYARFNTSFKGMGFGKLSPMNTLSDNSSSSGPGYYHKGDSYSSSISCGMMARCHKYLYAYLGVGYAENAQSYILDRKAPYPNEALDEIFPYGSKGCALDLGAIFKWKALLISCGYTATLGKSYPNGKFHNELFLGVGFTIHKHNKR